MSLSNKDYDHEHRREFRRSPNPDRSKSKGGSLIWKLTKGLEYIFSHKGMFWLGLTAATVSIGANVWFYVGILNNVAGWYGLPAWVGAMGISAFTTLFEVFPTVWKRNTRSALEMVFAAGAKPRDLPELDRSVVGDADRLISNYKYADRNSRRFFEFARWIAIALETFLGFIFLGRVGVGAKALFRLLLFVASIFGAEWGIGLALRASQWELPPAIRTQLNELLSNQNKPLTLKRQTTDR